MLSHEWSPMPTSSTNPQLTRSYLGEVDHQGLDIEASAQAISALNATQDDGLKPCMRWTMVRREGSVWTSWRPGKFRIYLREPERPSCAETSSGAAWIYDGPGSPDLKYADTSCLSCHGRIDSTQQSEELAVGSGIQADATGTSRGRLCTNVYSKRDSRRADGPVFSMMDLCNRCS